MSTQVTLTANQSAVVRDYNDTYNDHSSTVAELSHYYSNLTGHALLHRDYLMVSFSAPAAAYKHKKIENSFFQFYGKCTHSREFPDKDSVSVHPLNAVFSEASVNYDNSYHSCLNTDFIFQYFYPTTTDALYTSDSLDANFTLAALTYGLVFDSWNGILYNTTSFSSFLHTSRGANPPKLTVTFSDEDNAYFFTSTTPKAGSILNRVAENLFIGTLGLSGVSFEKPINTKTRLRWRVHGQSDVHEVVAPTTGKGVSVPANTFPGGSIDYQLIVDSTPGGEITSEWVTVSFVDSLSTALAVSPADTIIDGDADTVFTWEHINESGAPQTKAELEISKDSSAWSALTTVSGPDTSATVPAGKITTGTWYWRVRTYNLDNVAGSWSSPVRFLAVAHPSTPKILVTALEPRPAIQWQTNEQEAYQLQLGDLIDFTAYGPEKTWRCPVYLPDGGYPVRVRSQNQYGLWSAWGETELVITNEPGQEITLTVAAGYEATLSWSGLGYDFFIVYRDGVAIARTAEGYYVDCWSAGDVVYQVRGCNDDNSFYGLSNEVQVEILPETLMIAPVDSGEWLSLALSDTQHRTTKKSLGRTLSALQIAGRRFPAAELTEFYSLSLAGSCAFKTRQECKRFEALLGRLVCLKTKDGDMAVGYLEALSKTAGLFYATYSFTVTQIDYQEEINIDTGDLL